MDGEPSAKGPIPEARRRQARAYALGVEPARLLLVEDDPGLGEGLSQAFVAQGYDVDLAATGAAALAALGAKSPQLVLLDLGLPDIDGTILCRRVREEHPDVTLVVLTARHDEVDVVLALDAGADDYLTKPFRLAELLARIRAHLRRPRANAAADQLVVGDLTLDPAAHRAWRGDEELDLRAKEFDLLSLLMAEAGRALPRERIMAEVWDEHWFGSTKTLDVTVSSLRRKLGEQGDQDSRIATLRGVGYRLER
jgi:DNA-binding response OmpR family regulator